MMETCLAGPSGDESLLPPGAEARRTAGDGVVGGPSEPCSPAFEALWARHRPQLARAATRLTNNRHDAEDLVQDSMLRALRYHGRFQTGSNFAAWALRILYHTHCSTWRISRGRQTTIPWDTMDERIGVWSQDQFGSPDPAQPEEAMLAGVADEELETALRSLPIEYRQPFELASLGGLTYAEISDVMQLPIGTVRSRLYRARVQLRIRLAAYGETHGLLKAEAAAT